MWKWGINCCVSVFGSLKDQVLWNAQCQSCVERGMLFVTKFRALSPWLSLPPKDALIIWTIKAMSRPNVMSNGLLKNGFQKWYWLIYLNCRTSADFSGLHLLSKLSSFLFPRKVSSSSSSRCPPSSVIFVQSAHL